MEFTRKETQTIMDGLVIRWYGQVIWVDHPEISASRNGVLISGSWPVVKSVQEIKDILDLAEAEYKKLAGGR